RPCRERPSGYTAEKCDEFPPPHGAYPKAKDHGTKYSRCWSGSGARIAIKRSPYDRVGIIEAGRAACPECRPCSRDPQLERPTYGESSKPVRTVSWGRVRHPWPAE